MISSVVYFIYKVYFLNSYFIMSLTLLLLFLKSNQILITPVYVAPLLSLQGVVLWNVGDDLMNCWGWSHEL